MALFLEVHEVRGKDDAATLAQVAGRTGVRFLKHWLGADGRKLAVLVEAPDEATLRAARRNPIEITELFAPAERWLGLESIEVA